MRNSLYILSLVLLLQSTLSNLHLKGGEIPSLAGRLEKHVSVLASDSLEGRGLGTEGKIIAKNYIAGQFRDIGLKPLNDDHFHHFDVRIGLAWVPGTNVTGYLQGSDPGLKEEYILIGAHYDHLGYEYRNGDRVIYPGADDNASGTAVLIELARLLSENPELLGRSVIFVAFDAEESGLLGAEKFIGKEHKFDTGSIKVMFSLDMVGMYEANNGLELRGIGTLESGGDLAREMASALGIRIRRTTAEIEARTDTRPFGAAGIPAVHAYTGTKSPYHKPGDVYHLLDYEGMAGITLYLRSLVTEMSVLPALDPSRRFARLQQPWALHFSAGLSASIGNTHHKYSDEFYQAKSVFAFSTGMFLQVRVGQKFSVQPEILYDYNGSKSPEGTFRRHSVTVPVNLRYYLAGDVGGLVRIHPVTGIYLRYNLAGTDGGTDLDLGGAHPSQEWGINLGFGMEIMKVQISCTWRRGITDISAVPGTRIFDDGRYFTIGYRF